ncbi:hypothetical protein [Hyphococcus sp.]|uniref:hypothetical protein n=1 Tax=Hyphococcus sp. TaxID=2038636 RepID=UPI00207F6A57|nr:MAG: hypothetical protein DHS20C04_09130 [Marinicaulis sp.]
MFGVGEWVSVKAYGFIDHFGLATGDGRIISNSMRHGGVVIQSEAEFSSGKPITRYGSPDPHRGQVAVMLAIGRIGEPWSAFSDNCEHFVRWAYGMKAESPQAAALSALSVLVGGILFLVRVGR